MSINAGCFYCIYCIVACRYKLVSQGTGPGKWHTSTKELRNTALRYRTYLVCCACLYTFRSLSADISFWSFERRSYASWFFGLSTLLYSMLTCSRNVTRLHREFSATRLIWFLSSNVQLGLGVTTLGLNDGESQTTWSNVPSVAGEEFFYSVARQTGTDTLLSLAPSTSMNHTFAVVSWEAGSSAAKVVAHIADVSAHHYANASLHLCTHLSYLLSRTCCRSYIHTCARVHVLHCPLFAVDAVHPIIDR